jgi:osmotically-inducible protein OsmY
MIVDRSAAGNLLADEGIELRAGNRINEKFGDKVHVNVTSYNRMLLLTGEVPDAGIKADIEKLAVRRAQRQVDQQRAGDRRALQLRRPQQRHLHHLQGQGPLRRRQQVPPNHVKVVTEAGVVFLLGLVTQARPTTRWRSPAPRAACRRWCACSRSSSAEQAKALDNKPADPCRNPSRPTAK